MSSPPSTLGQYQIIREIARSNDIVYEAYDPLMNRRVAVKELAIPSGMTDAQRQDRVSRFKREAQAAGTLNHPNIMTVYSFAEDAGRIFMAMEFLDGHTLRNEIDTKGFLSPERAVEISVHVLEGLAHAHSKGVIHRDIKPDNIQILSNGQVKITDFGIARLTFQPNLTMDGQVFGTPSYMSPEQVVGREIDARSDLFSVAVVLFEMLSGQKPFAGDSVVSITYAIMNKEPQQPSQCDWALWQVLSRALDKSPQLRHRDADEMVSALTEARRQAASGMMSSSSANSGFNPNHPNNPTGAYTSPYANPTAGYSALNPNSGVSPYAAPTPPNYNQQPYNPYQSNTPPVHVPPNQAIPGPNFGYSQQPYGQPQYPTPAPPQYAYNPYQPPAYPPNPYAPGGQPGYGGNAPLPIFYPPPTRPPMFKPDTIVFIKKLVVAFIILGTLFALVLIGLNALTGVMQRRGSSDEDARVAATIRNLDKKIPVRERVDKASALMNELPAGQRSASQQATSELMAQLAQIEMRNGSSASAENYMRGAADLSPLNASHWAQLGEMYFRKATSAGPEEKVSLLKQSGEEMSKASSLASDVDSRRRYADRAATAFFEAAKTLFEQSPTQRSEVRGLLYDARSAAPSNSPVIAHINETLGWLEGQ